jgi:hypothetical protein
VPLLGSAFDPFDAITGGTWPVQSDNSWEWDYIGEGSQVIAYYRAANRAPCGSTILQQMQISCPDGTWANYGPLNTLLYKITAGTVTSGRAGVSGTRRW